MPFITYISHPLIYLNHAVIFILCTGFTSSAAIGFSAIQHTDDIHSSISIPENPCPEGEFLDLIAEVCRPLAAEWGFDAAEFQAQFSHAEFTLSTCTQDSLKDILSQAKPTGGTVFLPACTIPLTQSITIPSNVIFQGAGLDQTIFEAQPDFSGNMLRSKQATNIIIRDLTVDGADTDSTGILTWYVRNVLIERVRAHHNGGSGITFRYAQKITIRYSESHDHAEFHGIGSKDCFPNDDEIPDALECQIDAGDTTPGTLWSQDYAVYANRLYNNGDYGINIHASSGEIAGNISQNNVYGSKFPDASRLWIHHNRMSGNRLWGLYMYNTQDASARIAGNAIIYENLFADNGNYPVRIHEPAHNVIVVDNAYEANELNRLRIVNASVYICPESPESAIGVDGTPTQSATAEQCALENLAELFPLSFLYLPLSIYE